MEKKSSIKNFIGVYDNYISKEECDKAIKLFDDQNKFNNTLNRMDFENAVLTEKQDRQFFANAQSLDIWFNELNTIMVNFDLAWKHYMKNTGAEDAYINQPIQYTGLKIQKTLPTEGYHIWHIEHGNSMETSFRAFVYSIYLNDVEEGGETEFLHFSQRIKPKTGRIVIWPAAFPYLHRGNPPLSGKKYILTSWLKLSPYPKN